MKKLYSICVAMLVMFATKDVCYAQNVGIGTASPNVKLDVSGAIASREGTAFSNTQLTPSGGPFNDVVLPSSNSFFRIPSGLTHITGPFTINGIAGGHDGQELIITNQSGYAMTLSNLSASNASATDQILLSNGGTTLTIANGSTVSLRYSINVANSSSTGVWLVTATEVPVTAGTVTTFSAGTLSPLFTTNVTNASSTPSLSFALSNAGAYTVFGNNTALSAAPAYFTPSLTSAMFQNEGTTTTILHGNAGGNLSWSAVNLATDATGTLPVGNGGTGATSLTSDGIIYGNGASAVSATAAGTTGQILTNAAGVPAWTTATYPATTNVNRILYSTAANTVGQITTAANGVLITGAAGAPSISTTIPIATQTNITELGTINTGVWNGATIAVANGGTGATTFTTNGIVYGNGAGALGVTGVGSTGQVLQSNGGGSAPTWVTPTSGTVTSVGLSLPSIFTVTGSPVTSSGTLTGSLASETANTIFAAPNGSAGTPTFRSLVNADFPTSGVTAGTYNNITVNAQGIATVGSNVAYLTTAVTSFSSGNLSPLFTTSVATPTTTPVQSFTLSNAAAYTIFGNNTNASAAPAYFAPSLASALFANQGTASTILHGNATGNPSWGAVSLTSDVTGTLPVGNGGTGVTTLTSNGIVYGNGASAVGITAAGTSSQILTNTAGVPNWTTATYPSTTTINQLLYSSATNTVTGLPTVNNAILTTSATGVPTWSTTAVSSVAWMLTGNSGTTYGTNFIGTNDNQALGFKVFGNIAGRIEDIKTANNAYGNTSLGYLALSTISGAYSNVAIGKEALENNTANKNTAIGDSSLATNTTGTFNTAVGYQSLTKNSTAKNNTAIGYGVLKANTTGADNTATGTNTLSSNLTGNSNSAFGLNALAANTTGDNNVAVGDSALISNTTAVSNTAVGYSALSWNTSGSYNTAIGDSALQTNISGYQNTAIGYYALQTNTLGYNNTGIGTNTLSSNTTGHGNTAVGFNALSSITTNNFNSAFGMEALWSLTGGAGNNAFGYHALGSITNANFNTAMGSGAMFNATTGNDNTALGYAALDNNTGGNDNVAIGFEANLSNTGGGDDNVAIGSNSLYSNSGTGNVGIGFWTMRTAITGNYNSAIGDSSLYNNLTGSNNTANGYSSLYNSLTSNNTAFGFRAAYNNTSATSQTAAGYKALYSTTTGSHNTAFGDSALYTNATGTNNTAVGYQADVSSSGLTNATVVGAGASALASNSVTLGNSSASSLYLPGYNTVGEIFYTSAANGLITALAPATNQNVLKLVGGVPTWGGISLSSAAAVNGQLGVTNGGTGLASTTINQILYSSATNTIAGLATANNGVLVTGGTGVPSIGTTLPIAVQTNITELGTITTGTWNGTTITVANGGTGATTFAADGIIYGNGAGALGVTTAGTAGQVLQSNGTGFAPSWATISGTGTVTSVALTAPSAFTVSGTPITGAGTLAITGAGTTAQYIDGTGSLQTFPALASAGFANQGTTTTVLHGNAAGNPSWGAVNLTTDVTGVLPVANGGAPTGTASQTLYYNGTTLTNTSTLTNDGNGDIGIGQVAASSGTPTALTVTGAASTGLTASTAVPDIYFNLNRTVTFAAGAITTQRATYITAPTYSFSGASTITNAATVDISGPPVAGTNATITNPTALVVESGNTGLGTLAPAPNARLAIKDGHFESQQTTAPTGAPYPSGALGNPAKGAAVTLTNATDVGGSITTTAGTIVFSVVQGAVITFNKSYTTAPTVILTPADATTASAMATKQIYATSTTTAFTINFGNVPLTASVVYNFNYFVLETK